MADDFSADGSSESAGTATLAVDVGAAGDGDRAGTAALGVDVGAGGDSRPAGTARLGAGSTATGSRDRSGTAWVLAGLGATGAAAPTGRAILEPVLAGPRVVWGVEGTGAAGLLLTTLGVDLPEEPARRVDLATELRTVEWGD